KGFIELGNTQNALTFLQKANDDISTVNGIIFCSNETINTVISMKKSRADAEGCALNVKIEEECATNIDDYDLCRVLMNLIDNAINAAVMTQEKLFDIEIFIQPDIVSIKTSNPYIQKKNVKSRAGHGYGTGIISEICKKYDGSYSKKEIDGIYYTDTVLKNIKK
ncbi:MAG: GHKL domain-containing protein, partial [Clostridia bacterium]|nr:GHKL domain-containing protein [Clostridia bacterium]